MARRISKFLCAMLVICMVVSMVPAAVFAASLSPYPSKLYLKPNANWLEADARFAAYYFGGNNTNGVWESMTDSDGDGIYEVPVPSTFESVIFCRMNPATSENNWDNKWNQTADLALPTDGTDVYTITAGTWDNGGGTWSNSCGTVVAHKFVNGTCSVCGASQNCDHSSHNINGYCTDCGASVAHTYLSGVCTVCGGSDPAYVEEEWYLFGYINGTNYGEYDDAASTGYFRLYPTGEANTFGKTFNVTEDSYIAVKNGSNTRWYMTDGWQGEDVTSVTLYDSSTLGEDADKLYIPAGKVTVNVTVNGDGTMTLSYTVQQTAVCEHPSHDQNGYCTVCHYTVEHTYVGGTCSVCGKADPSASTQAGYIQVTNASAITAGGKFVLVALVDGTYYAMTTSLSSGKFVGQAVTVSGNTVSGTDLPVWTIAPTTAGISLSVDGSYLSYNSSTNFKFVTSAYDWSVTAGDSGFIFNAVDTTRGIYCQASSAKFGAYSQSYVNSASYVSNLLVFKYQSGAACSHSYTSEVTTPAGCLTDGVKTYTCSLCGDSYTEAIPYTGHSYNYGTCMNCGATDPNYVPHYNEYYLVGYINGANYGCEEDHANLGEYKFVDGKLTATFEQDSYVFLKTSDNSKWYLADAYCTDTVCTFSTGKSEKMLVPGGITINFTLVENDDGSLTLSYTSSDIEVVTPTLTLKNPTLAFEDEILYNVYFNVSDMSSVVEMGMITFATRNENGTVADALETIPGYVSNSDGSYTVHSNGVPAKMLGDALYFKAYAKLSDGSYVYTDIAGYHAVLYANTILNSSAASAQAKSLVVAMLNYGAAAQVSFEYKTDSLMNANLTSAQKALVSAYSESMIAAVPSVSTTKAGSFVNNGGYSGARPTVSFEGAFSINYYFTPKYTPSNGTITFYYWNLSDFNANSVLKATNATGSVQMTDSNGSYIAAVEGIAAKSIDEAVYVAAQYTYNGTTYYTPVIGYSLGQYCKTLAANGEAIGSATAVYGYYAKAYFAN